MCTNVAATWLPHIDVMQGVGMDVEYNDKGSIVIAIRRGSIMGIPPVGCGRVSWHIKERRGILAAVRVGGSMMGRMAQLADLA